VTEPRSTAHAPSAMAAAIKTQAHAIGFDSVGITDPQPDPVLEKRLRAFLAADHHGTMAWMKTRIAERADPRTLWPQANAIIMLGMNYGPEHNPLAALHHKNKGAISVYAQHRDYHDVVKKRLKELARWIVASYGGTLKVFVDTAPVMEKPLAERARLGWQGKHTNLVSRAHGSWLFLGAIFTTLALATDEPETDHCGQCTACLDSCPTNAFPAPYQLDARRCISYLTIEHKGPIPEQFRTAMGNRIYGCDDCLAVCPWNKFATLAREHKLQARDDLKAPDLGFLMSLDDVAFRAHFSGSSIKRIGRNRFVRNVLIAAGNSGNAEFLGPVSQLMQDADAVVAQTARWARDQLQRP